MQYLEIKICKILINYLKRYHVCNIKVVGLKKSFCVNESLLEYN